jgi:hypothetical protein
MGEQDLVDDMDAVAVLKLQERRHHAQAAVDERVTQNLPAVVLDQRVGDVCLPVGIGRSTFVGARALQAELEPESGLDAVDPQKKLRGWNVHGTTSSAPMILWLARKIGQSPSLLSWAIWLERKTR